MTRSSDMIIAWIRAFEDVQPQYGPLLQATVDEVGYPAIDSNGTIRTIRDGLNFWGAGAYVRGFAGHRAETMMYQALGSEYPACQKADDEEGMVAALAKGKFYETLRDWITSNDADKLPMETTPKWLIPFVLERENSEPVAPVPGFRSPSAELDDEGVKHAHSDQIGSQTPPGVAQNPVDSPFEDPVDAPLEDEDRYAAEVEAQEAFERAERISEAQYLLKSSKGQVRRSSTMD
jgi:hypothetical protein